MTSVFDRLFLYRLSYEVRLEQVVGDFYYCRNVDVKGRNECSASSTTTAFESGWGKLTTID